MKVNNEPIRVEDITEQAVELTVVFIYEQSQLWGETINERGWYWEVANFTSGSNMGLTGPFASAASAFADAMAAFPELARIYE